MTNGNSLRGGYVMRGDFAEKRYLNMPSNRTYTGRILAGVLAGTIGLGAVGVARSNISKWTAMSYRQNIAPEFREPQYHGKWGEPHRTESNTLWGEIAHHNLPGNQIYWLEITRQNSENKKKLAKGYQQGVMLQIPKPDEFGR